MNLLFALAQASWQGAVFTVLVGAVCALRLPASVRATLWLLVGVKFVGVFLWLLCFGERGAVGVDVLPHVAMRVPSAFTNMLDAVWIVGAGVCAMTVLLRVRATYRRVRGASGAVSPDVQSILAALVSPPVPTVRIVPANESPQVTILGAKPVVLLPADLLPPSPDALALPDLRLLLAHEIAHIRRGDLWAGWVFALAQTLFFFHPCVAWAKHEWEIAREEACDLFALRACGAKDAATAQYGALLLRMGGVSRSRFGGQSTTGVAFLAASPFAALRRRLQHLGRLKTAQTPLARCCAGLLLLLFGALLLPLRPVFTAPGTATPPVRLASVPATPMLVAWATIAMPKTPLTAHRLAWVSPRLSSPVPRLLAHRTRLITRRRQPPTNRRRSPVFLNIPNPATAPTLATNAPPVLRLSIGIPPEPVAAPIPTVPEIPEVFAGNQQEVATVTVSDEVPFASRPETVATPETPTVRGTSATSTSRARTQSMTPQPSLPAPPEVRTANPLSGNEEAPSPRPH